MKKVVLPFWSVLFEGYEHRNSKQLYSTSGTRSSRTTDRSRAAKYDQVEMPLDITKE